MTILGRWIPAALVAVLCVHSSAVATTVVTTCGQVVQGTAILEADLDCSAAGGDHAVRMVGGSLQLNGFTLTSPTTANTAAIYCTATCRVIGPGTILGGILAPSSLNLLVKVSDVTFLPNDTDDYVVIDPGKVKLIRVTATGQTTGVWALNKTKLIDSQLTGSGGLGFFTNLGSYGGKNTLVRSSITGFADAGIGTPDGYVRLIDSQVTGNALSPPCATACADIWSPVAPRLKGTSVCGTSATYPVGGSWGVCSND